MKTCIAFLTKDRVRLSEQTIEPLLDIDADILWCDGSKTEEGIAFPYKVMDRLPSTHRVKVMTNVGGGPDAAVAYALTTMLKGLDYSHVGICENDVLLRPDWYGPTMALFERCAREGLVVGAASARCFEDRILFQRDGYAVCHNTGWGMQIMTRQAAQLALKHMRTSWTTENRRLFAQLSNVDIGRYWAFRGGEHMLCADWGNDRVLAAHGLASVALVPSPVEMIGQVPPLHEQGLKLAAEPVELLRSDDDFGTYVRRQELIHAGTWRPACDHFLRDAAGYVIFAHQVPEIGGAYSGDWRLKWVMGFGPFAYRAGVVDSGEAYSSAPGACPTLHVKISGPVDVLVGGSGRFKIEDSSGFSISPEPNSSNDIMSVHVPASCAYHALTIAAEAPDAVFHGLKVYHPQPTIPAVSFDHDKLPPV